MTQTVTVWLETRDKFGDVAITGERTVSGCVIAPRARPQSDPETSGPRLQVTSGRTLYTPPNSGLTSQHRVRLPDGTVWRVEGEPGQWRSPWGWYPGDQAELERITG